MVIIGGEADGNEGDSLRRRTKRAANRQPCPKRSVEQGEEVEDVDRFRVVKRTKRAAAAGRAESSTRAAVGGGAASSSAADAEASGEGVEVAAREDVERPSEAGRLRASPGRFAKFNSSLSPPQKSELVSRLFGGLLNLSDTLPGDFSKFLVQSYQPETSEIVFPGRGSICVDADSVQRVFDLPNRGLKVSYKVDKDTTRRFRETFNITGTSHPQISTWTKMIKDMGGRTDDTLFMACLAVKQTICCFLYHLMILYLDALVHDIPVSNCAI
ncbi:hypothetical protein VPH35_094749 [Triticum aestivum]